MVNLDDGLVGVVFLMCLARVVFAGGVNRPRDELAIRAIADDDVNVVHLTVIDRSAERLDRVDDDGVGGGGVQFGVRHRLRDLVFAVPNIVFGHKGLPPGVDGKKLLASISIMRKYFPQ